MKTFLQTPYAQSHVPDWHDKLQEIEFHSEESHSEDLNHHQEREEWMILADFSHHNLNDNKGIANDHNWQIHTIPYTPQQLLEKIFNAPLDNKQETNIRKTSSKSLQRQFYFQ